MAKKSKSNVYRWHLKETGEHYTVRLSREAFDKLANSEAKKYSKKLKKHMPFKLIKKVK